MSSMLQTLPPALLLSVFLQIASAQLQIPILQQKIPTDYAPITNVDCPDVSREPLVRAFPPENQTLHPAEEEYVNARARDILPAAWAEWLDEDLGYNIGDFNGNFPKVGIAIPGGGLRAAQYGAACLEALDARNDSARDAGTGGLLQVASYITGLSGACVLCARRACINTGAGGSWITASMYFNGWPTINDLVFGGNGLSGWMLDIPLVTPAGTNLFTKENQWFFGSLLWSVKAKGDAGMCASVHSYSCSVLMCCS
jgi:lysophospholipase